MASRWQTYPITFDGGLITNKPGVLQGLEQSGSCIEMINVEPTIEGGYARVLGYKKFTSDKVPAYGASNTVGRVFSSTDFEINTISEAPKIGDTFTIDGLSTSDLEITSVAYYGNLNVARVTVAAYTGSTITSDVAGDEITWVSVESPPDGVYVFNNSKIMVKRGGALWTAEQDDNWKAVQICSSCYADDVLFGVRTESATPAGSNTLRMKNLAAIPKTRDTFTIKGDPTVYTVTGYYSNDVLTGGEITIGIFPKLQSAVTANTKIDFLYPGLNPGGNLKGSNFQFGPAQEFLFVDGKSPPWKITSDNRFVWLSDYPTSSDTSSDVVVYKSTVFLADKNIITFSAPSNERDYSAANGGGQINVGDNITRLWPFKTSLIVFCKTRILMLNGNSAADLVLTTITDEIGCEAPDSIQEIGGDVLYMAPDGVRMLSDTDKSGSFGLTLASENIRRDMTNFQNKYRQNICSIILKNKNQYRVFGYARGSDSDKAGFSATQFADKGLQWCELLGFNVQRAHSFYNQLEELAVFTNHSDYVYRIDDGNSFDGSAISWAFSTPHLALTDPVIRKSLFKMTLYTRQEGEFKGNIDISLDFVTGNNVQPSVLTFSEAAGDTYGETFVYGSSVWGSTRPFAFGINTPCSGFTFSIRFYGTDTNKPFIMDHLFLEFSEKGRQ